MPSDRSPASDEVLRRVGRNLVTFQMIESFLKFLIANSNLSHFVGGDGVPLQESGEARNKVAVSTLGQLVGRYVADVMVDAGVDLPESELPEKAIFGSRFSFVMESDRETLDSLRLDLKRMTEARNELVHGFLPRWKPQNENAMKEALAYLDAQRETVLPMFDHLRSNALQLLHSRQSMESYMASPEFAREIELMWLHRSPLVQLLCDVAGQRQRADGWTYLATAGQIAARELPDDLRGLNSRYGFRTLRKLLIGSELFEVTDEPLATGGFRTLYRRKTEQ